MVKSKAKAIEECQTLFEIEVPKDDLDKAFNDVYEEITKVADIPGFRVGKAPKDLVKKHYAKNAREEVLKRIIPESYRKAIEAHGINPIALPEISDVDFDAEHPLSFKAKVETRPKFKLKNYKSVRIEKKKIEIKPEDVDRTLENLREMNASYTVVEDRPVQLGDYVVSDLECFVDGKQIHKKRENLWLYIDKESLVPELNEKIVGMNKGEERDIEVTLPEKYPDKNVAGKLAKYHIRAKEIKSRVLPNLDNDFAKDLGKPDLESLKKEIAKELEAKAALGAEISMENQLLKKLIDDNVFPVPPSFVRRQLDFMVEDAKRRLEEKGFKREDLDKKDKEFIDKFGDDAVRQVRLLFILDEIANAEGITVNDEDVEGAYKTISQRTGQGVEKVKNYYESEELVENLRDKLREEKAIKFLLKNAQVVEV